MKALLATLLLMTMGIHLSGCSKSNPQITSRNRFGIINGDQVAESGYNGPVVAIIRNLKLDNGAIFAFEELCTGTLIARDVVLTAAHCVKRSAAKDLTVFPGTVDIFKDSKLQPYRVKAFAVHPRYMPGFARFDLALFKLENEIPESIQLAELPSGQVDFKSIDDFTAFGFGDTLDVGTSESGWDGGGVLRKMKYKAQSTSYEPADTDPAVMKSRAKDAAVCGGDSGGPLMLVGPDQSQVIVGITKGSSYSYDGQKQADYLSAREDGDINRFYRKYPETPRCRGGTDYFVSVAFHREWIDSVVEAFANLKK